MTGLSPSQLLEHVVRPTLAYLDLPGGEVAERLVMGTGAQESAGFRYLHQLGRGPALGLFQMEPATFKDLWFRALKVEGRVWLRQRIGELIAPRPEPKLQLITNLAFAVAMCRAHYYLRPFRLEAGASVEHLAAWWKRYYNTPLGAGTEEEFIAKYKVYVAPLFGGR